MQVNNPITQSPSYIPEETVAEVDAKNLRYRDLNRRLKEIDKEYVRNIRIIHVEGQRYIGTDLKNIQRIDIHGTPGNDLGCFMNGPVITVHGNAQDGCGNTMSDGTIIVHGSAGDILGYAMRGGKIFIEGDAGYRTGIHMKEYRDHKPIIVIGGSVGDFSGEYMAGGILVILGLNQNLHKARYLGTGMHGGVIYIHGESTSLGKEIEKMELDAKDYSILHPIIKEFASHFNLNSERLIKRSYIKIRSKSTRPYGTLYAY